MFNPLQSFTSALRLAMPLRASSSRRTLVSAFRPMIASSSSRSIVNITLSNIKKAPGSSQHTRRRGRGVGSGKGGHTSGRGHKGARARGTGVPYRGFEGGQTPLHRRLPKRGFVNMLRKEYAPLNIASLQQWIQAKRIDPTQPITIHQVVQSNLVHSISKISGVKLLGEADPTIPLPPLDCQLSKYSKKAARQIIAAGGKVSAVYHNNLGLRAEAYPQKFPGIKQAKPTRRADIEYYTDPKNHGYLSSPEVKEAFFRERGWRTPEEKKADKEAYAMVKY